MATTITTGSASACIPLSSAEKKENTANEEETAFLQLIGRVMTEGDARSDRTGVGTRSIFGTQLRFSLQNRRIPLLTTKQVAWRSVVEELLWMMSGSTDSKQLAEKKVHIWDANGSRANLDRLGFMTREEGQLGPVYGHQWRHFGAPYHPAGFHADRQGVDQLSSVVQLLRNDPNSRRILMSAWNPVQLPQMILPPCHVLAQFYVTSSTKLSCQMYQRSADLGLGAPFNIASYSLLTHMLAHITGLEPYEFIYTIGDAHVYNNHMEGLATQLQRIPRPFPTLKPLPTTIKQLDDFTSGAAAVAADCIVLDYDPYPSIALPMAL